MVGEPENNGAQIVLRLVAQHRQRKAAQRRVALPAVAGDRRGQLRRPAVVANGRRGWVEHVPGGVGALCGRRVLAQGCEVLRHLARERRHARVERVVAAARQVALAGGRLHALQVRQQHRQRAEHDPRAAAHGHHRNREDAVAAHGRRHPQANARRQRAALGQRQTAREQQRVRRLGHQRALELDLRATEQDDRRRQQRNLSPLRAARGRAVQHRGGRDAQRVLRREHRAGPAIERMDRPQQQRIAHRPVLVAMQVAARRHRVGHRIGVAGKRHTRATGPQADARESQSNERCVPSAHPRIFAGRRDIGGATVFGAHDLSCRSR